MLDRLSPNLPGLAFLLAGGLAVLWAIGVLAIRHRLTRPPRRTYASALARGRPGDPSELSPPRAFRSWSFEHAAGASPAWELVGDDPDPRAPVVLMVHGWGDSRLGALVRLHAALPAAGLVIAVDLPGHGDAPGMSTLGMREPEIVRAMADALHTRLAPGRPIVLWGWSLGAGVCIAAGDHPAVAAVIAESPYRIPPTPARNVMRYYAMPHRFLLGPALRLTAALAGFGPGRDWSTYDRATLAARVRAPLLVLHGVIDDICPLEDGRAIAAAAPRGTLVEVEGRGHNDLWSGDAAACEQAVAGMLRIQPTGGRPGAPGGSPAPPGPP